MQSGVGAARIVLDLLSDHAMNPAPVKDHGVAVGQECILPLVLNRQSEVANGQGAIGSRTTTTVTRQEGEPEPRRTLFQDVLADSLV